MNKLTHKKWRIVFNAFVLLFLILTLFPIAVSAYSDYSVNDISVAGIADHIIVRTGFQNAVRTVGFSILQFLSLFIDKIYNAITTIANYNLYELVAKHSGISRDTLVMPLVWILLSIVLGIVAIRLFIKSDTKINEDILKFIMCFFIICVFPAFMSACHSLRSNLISDVKDVNVTDKSGTLGEQILASYVIDVGASMKNGELVYLNNSKSSNSISDADILSINAVFPNTSEQGTISDYVSFKVTDDPKEWNGTITYGIYDFSYILKELGIDNIYINYADALANNGKISILQSITADENGHLVQNYTYYSADEYADNIMLPKAKTAQVSTKAIPSELGININSYTSWSSFEEALKQAIDKYVTSKVSYDTAQPIDGTSLYTADVFSDYDLDVLLSSTENVTLDTLPTALGNYIEYLKRSIVTLGYPSENVYRYDYDFLFCLITLIATLVSLIFATLKLGKMLYELIFMEILAPVFIAIDSGSWEGQKTKQVINNIITTSAMFAIVILTLKIYLSVILNMFLISNMDFVVRLVFIIAGAAFVIDGPDSVVKILGMDAGVKSGYGALRGAQAGVRAATGAVRTTTKAAKSLGSIPGAVSSAYGTHKVNKNNVRQAKQQAREQGKGIIGRSIAANKARLGNTAIGSAYKKSFADNSRTNDDFNRYKVSSGNDVDIDTPANTTPLNSGNSAGAVSSNTTDTRSSTNSKDSASNTNNIIVNSDNNNNSVVGTNKTANSTSESSSSGTSVGANNSSGSASSASSDTNNSTVQTVSSTTSTPPVQTDKTQTSSQSGGKGFADSSQHNTSDDTSSADSSSYQIGTQRSNRREDIVKFADPDKIYYDRSKFNPFEGNEYFDSSKEE